MHNEISDNDNKNDFVRKSYLFKTHSLFLKNNDFFKLFLENFNQNQKNDELS